MSSKEIEIILSRQFSDCLSIPIFIVDPMGNLDFYNDPAEDLLGSNYNETGSLPVSVWSTIFKPQDDHGNFLPPNDLPLVETLTKKLPAHGTFWITNLNGPMYKISVTSFPIMGRPDRFLGAMAIFWKTLEK
jgi:hypothetical protein